MRAILQLKGLRQRDLAAGVGESQGTISRWLTGTANPNSEKLFKIADFLEVSLDQLIGRIPPGAEPLLQVHEEARSLADALGKVLPVVASVHGKTASRAGIGKRRTKPTSKTRKGRGR